MLHELLAALRGCTGGLFIEGKDGFEVFKGVTFLHPAEEVLLNRLCVLGAKYKYLTNFINTYKFANQDTGKLHGLYLYAFVHGIDNILKPYRAAIWELETEILNDPHISLTHLLKLEQFLPLFQHLMGAVDTLVSNKAHGCRILEIIYNLLHSGIPMVEICMHRLFKCCHAVLYRQMMTWMIHGILNDPYQEFFIQPKENEGTKIGNDDSNTSKSAILKDIPMCLQKQYMLRPEMLPSYIPSHVATKILFIGQSVPIFNPYLPVSDRKSDCYLSTFKKREKEFNQKFMDLLKEERFPLSKFIAIVEEIRACTAEILWQVVVEKSNLLGHLKIIKDFYLLGRGELFLSFIEHAKNVLKMPVTVTAEREVNDAFRVCAKQTSLESSKIAQNFCVTLRVNKENLQDVDKESISKIKLETGWSSIGLAYKVVSPLHIFFTSSALDKYNNIFRFLLLVRKVQIELHQCWALQMCSKNTKKDSSLISFWSLRSHMGFLIDNLQYYLQVDVLESQFSTLENKVQNIKDFEAIQQSHDHFLSSVISQSFLHMKPVYICFQEILELCSTFCDLIHRVQNAVSSNDLVQFGNIRLNFQRQTSLLFRVLCGVRSHQVSPHLAQLLLRIDYNKYLSLSGGHLGGPDFSIHAV